MLDPLSCLLTFQERFAIIKERGAEEKVLDGVRVGVALPEVKAV